MVDRPSQQTRSRRAYPRTVVQLPTVLVWLTGLTGLAWVVLELRQSRHSRPEARQGDRGSRVVIGVAAAVGILLAIAARRGTCKGRRFTVMILSLFALHRETL